MKLASIPRAIHRPAATRWMVVIFAGLAAWSFAAQPAPTEPISADELVRGQKQFVVFCARCHGMQGLGGVGPNLALPVLRQAPDLPALLDVIENGLPAAGMPGSWMLSKKDQRAIAGYVRSLGRAPAEPPPGDPARGRELYTRAACQVCHTIAGQGGVKGPDLTEVGNRRGVARLRRMLLEPGAEKIISSAGRTEYLPVKVTTLDGSVIEGLRVNEDGFTLQLRDLEDRIHSIRKSAIKELNKGFEQSIMPAFGQAFNPAELDDLVAFLASLKGVK